MMRYRDRDEIFTSILHAAGLDGARLTKLMYSSFLSYSKVVEYLTNLVENDFLHYNRTEKIFTVTPKGLRYLSMREKLCEILNLGPNTLNIET